MKITFQELKTLKKQYPQARIKPQHTSKLTKCPYCGKLFIKPHHKSKFCSKDCFTKSRLDYKAKWKREKYIPKKPRLGSSSINSHRNKDFDKEYEIIHKELRRLKL